MDFQTSTLHVRRVKQGTPSTHPVRGDELRALRRLQREQQPKSPFVFKSERDAPLTTAGFARMVERAGAQAGLGFKAHSHMLRHACGFALANKGHDTWALQAYLGHKNIQHEEGVVVSNSVAIQDHPGIMLAVELHPPSLLSNKPIVMDAPLGRWMRPVMLNSEYVRRWKEGKRELVLSDGTASLADFGRTLAKIAHAYACARVGLGAFIPYLPRSIRNRGGASAFSVRWRGVHSVVENWDRSYT